MPVAIIVIAALAVAIGQRLPASFAGFGVFGPYTVLLVGASISLWFNRGRAFIVLLSLLIAFVGYQLAQDPQSINFAGRAVFAALAVFVPLNILIALRSEERGISHFHNYRWVLLLITQILLTAWVAGAGKSALSGTAWHAMLEHWLIRPAPVPFLGRVLMAAAFAVAVFKAWKEHSTALHRHGRHAGGILRGLPVAHYARVCLRPSSRQRGPSCWWRCCRSRTAWRSTTN